jgi:hypothetical protein
MNSLTIFASAGTDQPNRGKASQAAVSRIDVTWTFSSMRSGDHLRSLACREQDSRSFASERIAVPFDLSPGRPGVPDNPVRLGRALRWLLKQMTAGRVVEIGCMGRQGRTGTTLGLLALQGLNAKAAVDKVGTNISRKRSNLRSRVTSSSRSPTNEGALARGLRSLSHPHRMPDSYPLNFPLTLMRSLGDLTRLRPLPP